MIIDARENIKANRVRDSIGGFRSDWERISPYERLDRKERGIGVFAQGAQALRPEVDEGKRRDDARRDEDAGRVLAEF